MSTNRGYFASAARERVKQRNHWFIREKNLFITRSISGLPAVVTITAYIPDTTLDDVPIPEACRRLEEAGATVVGINCSRGPSTMIPLIREIRKVCEVCILVFVLPLAGNNSIALAQILDTVLNRNRQVYF